MDRLFLTSVLCLITLWFIVQPCAAINKDNKASASETWQSKCQPMPSDPAPPDLEDLKLDEILSTGTFQMDLKTRKTYTPSLDATFVFGEPGSGKSIVTPFLVGELDTLNIGLAKSNNTVIYLKKNRNAPKSTNDMLAELIPDYYLLQSDDINQTVIWDCPGFGYNRGSKADIAQMYFLKHTIEMTKSAKFVFTITHTSVMLENDVRTLATNAVTFIKDVRKFKNSIGLIVTGVDERDANNGQENILLSIRNSLKSFAEVEKNSIKNKNYNSRDANESYQTMQRIGFIEGLLREEVGVDGNNSRICFIKNPEDCGSLPIMSTVRNTVSQLKVLQFKTLQHHKIQPEDFGLSLKTETRQEIKLLLGAEINGTAKYAAESSKGIIKELEKRLHRSSNEISMLENLNAFKNALDHYFVRPILGKRVFDEDHCGSLMEGTINDDVDFFMSCASQRLKTIEFLQKAMGGGFNEYLSAFREPFQLVRSRVSSLTYFFDYCSRTHEALSTYKAQKEYEDNALKLTKDRKKHEDSLFSILDKHVPCSLTFKKVWDDSLGDESKDYFYDLVYTLVGGTIRAMALDLPFCEYTLPSTFFGKYVLLSHVMSLNGLDAPDRPPTDYECSVISIVATEKFFIDRNVDTYVFNYMSVVAPVWEVTDYYWENNYTTKHQAVKSITLKGNHYYTGNGSFFYGLYHEIINSGNLSIRTDGNRKYEGLYAGESGSVHLVSTSSDETIDIESCPGSGKYYGNFTKLAYMPVHGVALYKSELIRTSLFNCYSSVSWDFFEKLAPYMEGMTRSYTPLSLIAELEAVEKEYFFKHNHIQNCPAATRKRLAIYYNSTLNLIKTMMVGASPEDKTAFTWIGSLIIGRQISDRRLDIALNVFKTEKYLEAVEADLIELETAEHYVAINKETADFKNKLDEKIQEANNIIEKMVTPAKEKAKNMIGKVNDQLVATLDAFLKAAEAEKEKAEKMKKEFQAALPLKHLLGGFNILATACGFFGPIGVGVGGAIKAVTSIGKSFVEGNPSIMGLTKFTAQLPDLSDKYYDEQIDKISPPDENEDIEELKQKKKRKRKLLQKIAIGTEVADETLEFVKSIQSEDAELQKLEMAIQEADAQIDGIKQKTEDFRNSFAPALDNLGDSILEESSMLSGKSEAGLTAKKYEINTLLQKMQSMVKGFTGWISDTQNSMKAAGVKVLGVPNVLENFLYSIDNLGKVLEVLFQLYSQIETYQERKDFAQFIANVNSPTAKELSGISNIELKDALTRVAASIKINMVFEEYKKAKHAFKQWVFPFPGYYLKGRKELSVIMPSHNFSDALIGCRAEISKFRNDIILENSQGSQLQKNVYHYSFVGDAKSSRPFYVWNHTNWQDAISRLFRGEEIHLKADVDLINHENQQFLRGFAAIKFRFVVLFIKAYDPSFQSALEEQLDNFRMFMTHSGVSIYKVNGQHYVTRDKPQDFKYNLEKGIGSNGLQHNVERPDSDFLLSPYTWWTFSINNIGGNNVSFDVLEQFSDKVDLLLEGEGTYLDENEASTEFLTNLNLEEYYEVYDPADEDVMNIGRSRTGPLPRRCGQATSFHKRSAKSTSRNFDKPFAPRIQTTVGNPANEQRCYSKLNCSENKDSATFEGEYQLVTDPDNDDFGNYLKAMDFSEDSQAEIRMTKKITVSIEEQKRSKYDVYILTNGTEREFERFKSGDELETSLADGRKVTHTITINKDDKSALRVIKMPGFDATNEAVFCYWGFNVTLKAKDATAFLLFKRVPDSV